MTNEDENTTVVDQHGNKFQAVTGNYIASRGGFSKSIDGDNSWWNILFNDWKLWFAPTGVMAVVTTLDENSKRLNIPFKFYHSFCSLDHWIVKGDNTLMTYSPKQFSDLFKVIDA